MNDLNTLMQACVDDACPDVDRLLTGAIRDGQRLRRRRRLSYAGAGLAVAAIAVAGPLVAGSLGGGTATEVAPAASGGPAAPTDTGAYAGPTAPALRPGEVLHLHRGATGTIVICKSGEPDPKVGNPKCVVPHEVTESPLVHPIYQGQDVAIHVPGWKLVGEVADDKQSLEGPGGAVADIVWRAASGYDDWIGGEKNDPGTWTSPVHDGVFVTIQGGQGTTAAQIQALGDSLTWK